QGTGERSVRVIKVRVVQNIKCFGTELDNMLFAKRNPSRKSQVNHVVSRTGQSVAADIPEASRHGAREGRGIEPHAGCGIRQSGIADQVEALSGRSSRKSDIAAAEEVQGSAGTCLKNRRDLPSPSDRLNPMIVKFRRC